MYTIDLNSDMGESFGAYRIGNDEGIIQHITSTNVACGYHAGGPMVMDKVVRMAKEWGVAVGAHPGYPDLMGFGPPEDDAVCGRGQKLHAVSDRGSHGVHPEL